MQRIETFCQTSQVNLKQVLKSWRDDGDGIYRSLRKILDRISVFAGNSPLVSLITSVRLAVAIPCTQAVVRLIMAVCSILWSTKVLHSHRN